MEKLPRSVTRGTLLCAFEGIVTSLHRVLTDEATWQDRPDGGVFAEVEELFEVEINKGIRLAVAPGNANRTFAWSERWCVPLYSVEYIHCWELKLSPNRLPGTVAPCRRCFVVGAAALGDCMCSTSRGTTTASTAHEVCFIVSMCQHSLLLLHGNAHALPGKYVQMLY